MTTLLPPLEKTAATAGETARLHYAARRRVWRPRREKQQGLVLSLQPGGPCVAKAVQLGRSLHLGPAEALIQALLQMRFAPCDAIAPSATLA